MRYRTGRIAPLVLLVLLAAAWPAAADVIIINTGINIGASSSAPNPFVPVFPPQLPSRFNSQASAVAIFSGLTGEVGASAMASSEFQARITTSGSQVVSLGGALPSSQNVVDFFVTPTHLAVIEASLDGPGIAGFSPGIGRASYNITPETNVFAASVFDQVGPVVDSSAAVSVNTFEMASGPAVFQLAATVSGTGALGGQIQGEFDTAPGFVTFSIDELAAITIFMAFQAAPGALASVDPGFSVAIVGVGSAAATMIGANNYRAELTASLAPGNYTAVWSGSGGSPFHADVLGFQGTSATLSLGLNFDPSTSVPEPAALALAVAGLGVGLARSLRIRAGRRGTS